MIFDNRKVVRNYRLAKIYPEWVNTVSGCWSWPGLTLPAPEVDERLVICMKTYLVLAPKMEAAITGAALP